MIPRTISNPFLAESDVDRSFLGGLALSVALVGLGLLASGKFLNFIDTQSFILVVGGTLCATLVNFGCAEIGYAWNALCTVMRRSSYDPLSRIRHLVRLAQAVRINGLLILEQEARLVDEPFIRFALEVTADGQSAEDIRRLLETEAHTNAEHAAKAVQVFESMGNYAPALGLIGTLIGLIQMLGALDDPATVGPAMALALVTTLYGAILANLFFLPIAGKIRNRNEELSVMRSITIEGAASLVKQENPVIVEQRLRSFVPRLAIS